MPPSSSSPGCLETVFQTPVVLIVIAFLLFLLIIFTIFIDLTIVVIVVCTFLLFFVLSFLMLKVREKRKLQGQYDGKKRKLQGQNDGTVQLPQLPLNKFLYEELRVATKGFTEKLGAGGFGTVFKGILEDGTMVAVKRLNKPSQDMKEFLAEVNSIGSIHHFNLVKLIGYCADQAFQLLVYEFMVNGSLDNWIFKRDLVPCLNWEMRKKIAMDIARGLAYLHEECHWRILHLDIKPENILLDENFNARISDFGLSKLIGRDESQVLTNMRGTPGYIAPEWQLLRITVKVDIYSYGIVLLETICGRRNSIGPGTSHLLRLLQRKSQENKFLDIVENYDEDIQIYAEEAERMIKLAAWCLQDDHTRRPSMSTVVKVLEGVMEVDSNISFNFTYALAEDLVLDIDHISPTLTGFCC